MKKTIIVRHCYRVPTFYSGKVKNSPETQTKLQATVIYYIRSAANHREIVVGVRDWLFVQP